MVSKRLLKAREWVHQNGVNRIGEAEFAALGQALGTAEPALRRIVRELGLPLEPVVEGVRQDSLDHLGRTLIALQREYEPGGPERRRSIRRMVITSKDHAKLASRRKPEKAEMVEIMLVWLENPPLFESWWRAWQTRRLR